jgi:hypothetical protein
MMRSGLERIISHIVINVAFHIFCQKNKQQTACTKFCAVFLLTHLILLIDKVYPVMPSQFTSTLLLTAQPAAVVVVRVVVVVGNAP